MQYFIRLLLLGWLLTPVYGLAAIEAYEFKNEQMESDYNQLIKELRCLVCQNQNLSGSDAALARDLRRQTHEMLMEGNRPEQVIQYMVERYGDFVLYRPQFKSSTVLLWAGPFILAGIVLVLVIRRIRSSQKLSEPDKEALQRARDLLSSNRNEP